MSDRPSASNIAIGGSGAQTSILFQALQAPSPCDFKVALKVGLRCLLRSADPACNTAATCRPCRPAASMRTLQQACRPCSSLMQQACRPLPCSKPTAAGSVGCRQACRPCRALQQPAGQQRLRATCRPCRTPPLQTLQWPYSKPAKPAACLSPSPHGFQSSITWAFSCIHTESISPCKHKGLKAPESAGSLKAPDL